MVVCKHLSIGLREFGVKEWVRLCLQGGGELGVQVQADPVCLLSDVLSRWTIPRTGECCHEEVQTLRVSFRPCVMADRRGQSWRGPGAQAAHAGQRCWETVFTQG